MFHCYYQWSGGEDSVFDAERELLRSRGVEVVTYVVRNDVLSDMSFGQKARIAVETVWNRSEYWKIREFLRRERVDVAHFHNTFPLLSPAAYAAAQDEDVGVVQTLHNYRLLCPNAQFRRDNRVCEDCKGKTFPAPAILHSCYRNSRATTSVVAGMLAANHVLGTWDKLVDSYIALTEFGRQKFIEGGFPAERIVVKPNFVFPDPGMGRGDGGFALFAGRHSEEKGIDVLIDAWRLLRNPMPLKILGEGPLTQKLKESAKNLSWVEFMGRVSESEKVRLRSQAAFLVFPSVWYEGFPMVIAEALSSGVPVISSGMGSMTSIIQDGRNGVLFEPGNPDNLAKKIDELVASPEKLLKMRVEARRDAEEKYSIGRNFEQLVGIYRSVIEKRSKK